MREHSEESVKFIPRYKVKIFVYKKIINLFVNKF
jgi:hypothetical protein